MIRRDGRSCAPQSTSELRRRPPPCADASDRWPGPGLPGHRGLCYAPGGLVQSPPACDQGPGPGSVPWDDSRSIPLAGRGGAAARGARGVLQGLQARAGGRAPSGGAFTWSPPTTRPRPAPCSRRSAAQGGGVTWAAILDALRSAAGDERAHRGRGAGIERRRSNAIVERRCRSFRHRRRRRRGPLLHRFGPAPAGRPSGRQAVNGRAAELEGAMGEADPLALECFSDDSAVAKLLGRMARPPEPSGAEARWRDEHLARLRAVLAAHRTWCWRPSGKAFGAAGGLTLQPDGRVTAFDPSGASIGGGRWKLEQEGRVGIIGDTAAVGLHYFDVEDSGHLGFNHQRRPGRNWTRVRSPPDPSKRTSRSRCRPARRRTPSRSGGWGRGGRQVGRYVRSSPTPARRGGTLAEPWQTNRATNERIPRRHPPILGELIIGGVLLGPLALGIFVVVGMVPRSIGSVPVGVCPAGWCEPRFSGRRGSTTRMARRRSRRRRSSATTPRAG